MSPERRNYLREAQRRWRAKFKANGGKYKPGGHKKRSFVGVDGEGAGRNRRGQQHYLLLRIGDRELYTGKPLTISQCLDFILDTPKDQLLVGYGFGYDATQILRGIADDTNRKRAEGRIKHLFAPKRRGPGKSPYTRWNDYGVEYLPRQYLTVSKQEHYKVEDELTGLEKIAWRTVEGSARTIYETVAFFQSTFLTAIKKWNIGAKHWAMIDRNKARRSAFKTMSREVRHYNRVECDLLAELMEAFREVCQDADLKPYTWNGPGKLAAYLHQKHRTITREVLETITPAEVLQFANDSYFGGRFEVTRVGEVAGPVYEYDLNSAYPHAMIDLPCLQHGKWTKAKPATLGASSRVFVARIQFTHPHGSEVCGFPIRQKTGKLFWPRQGGGVYWSPEIRAAERLGAKVTYIEGWTFTPKCKCKTFDWIEPLYRTRQALGDDLRGQPLKLALNSLYGKLAQRVGNPRFGNLIHAGLVTARTRAALMEVAAQRPEEVVMFATDAIFSTAPLKCDEGSRLGQWKGAKHDRLFVVQPGLYWGASRPKIRGIPSESLFKDHIPKFEKAWSGWLALYEALGTYPGPPPVVAVPMRMFIGLRLAAARNDLSLAGQWVYLGGKKGDLDVHRSAKQEGKKFRFSWKGKRSMEDFGLLDQCIVTTPCEGAPDLVSIPHRGADPETLAELDISKYLYDEQPDHVDLSPPI